jgi:hypothetical protein
MESLRSFQAFSQVDRPLSLLSTGLDRWVSPDVAHGNFPELFLKIGLKAEIPSRIKGREPFQNTLREVLVV